MKEGDRSNASCKEYSTLVTVLSNNERREERRSKASTDRERLWNLIL